MNPPDPKLSRSANQYEQALESAGWTRIGAGAGGRVFHRACDPDVIKVSDGDDCYLAFANFAAANPAPCLPDLRVVYQNGQWSVVHIELLAPLDSGNEAAVSTWWIDYQAAAKSKSARPAPADWSALADSLRPIASLGACGFDMKSENAMQRGATVVFTDPLF